MPRCNHCGGHVSADFARVFGTDERGVVACQDCSPNTGIAAVARDRARES